MIYKVAVHQENYLGIFATYFVEADTIGEAEQKALRCAIAEFAEEPYAESVCTYVSHTHNPDDMEADRKEYEKASTP